MQETVPSLVCLTFIEQFLNTSRSQCSQPHETDEEIEVWREEVNSPRLHRWEGVGQAEDQILICWISRIQRLLIQRVLCADQTVYGDWGA